jgi:hypothetical protein
VLKMSKKKVSFRIDVGFKCFSNYLREMVKSKCFLCYKEESAYTNLVLLLVPHLKNRLLLLLLLLLIIYKRLS